MEDLIKVLIEQLFARLEERFANRPLILMLLNTLEALIPSLIPLLLKDAKVRAQFTAAGVAVPD